MAAAIQGNLVEVGMDVGIETYEWNTFLAKVNRGLEGQADMAEMAWMTNDPDTLPYLALRSGATPAQVDEVRARLDLEFIAEDLDSVFEGCQEGVQRATTIVRDLRTFSRLDRGTASEIDLNAFLDTTVNLLKVRLAGLTVTREYDSTLPHVECLEGQLSQVFMNLVVNAADAAGDGGNVTLRTERCSQGRIAVEVLDDGPGIPPEVRSRIFEPFFTTKEVGKGTGLGLAISFGVVSRHSGTLQATDRPGGGTCFRVEIPIRHSPPDDPDEAQATKGNAR